MSCIIIDADYKKCISVDAYIPKCIDIRVDDAGYELCSFTLNGLLLDSFGSLTLSSAPSTVVKLQVRNSYGEEGNTCEIYELNGTINYGLGSPHIMVEMLNLDVLYIGGVHAQEGAGYDINNILTTATKLTHIRINDFTGDWQAGEVYLLLARDGMTEMEFSNIGLTTLTNPDFGVPKNLVKLDLHGNNISGILPMTGWDGFTYTNNLQYLDVSYNSFTDIYPNAIHSQSLNYVDLRHNGMDAYTVFYNLNRMSYSSVTGGAIYGYSGNEENVDLLKEEASLKWTLARFENKGWVHDFPYIPLESNPVAYIAIGVEGVSSEVSVIMTRNPTVLFAESGFGMFWSSEPTSETCGIVTVTYPYVQGSPDYGVSVTVPTIDDPLNPTNHVAKVQILGTYDCNFNYNNDVAETFTRGINIFEVPNGTKLSQLDVVGYNSELGTPKIMTLVNEDGGTALDVNVIFPTIWNVRMKNNAMTGSLAYDSTYAKYMDVVDLENNNIDGFDTRIPRNGVYFNVKNNNITQVLTKAQFITLFYSTAETIVADNILSCPEAEQQWFYKDIGASADKWKVFDISNNSLGYEPLMGILHGMRLKPETDLTGYTLNISGNSAVIATGSVVVSQLQARGATILADYGSVPSYYIDVLTSNVPTVEALYSYAIDTIVDLETGYSRVWLLAKYYTLIDHSNILG